MVTITLTISLPRAETVVKWAVWPFTFWHWLNEPIPDEPGVPW